MTAEDEAAAKAEPKATNSDPGQGKKLSGAELKAQKKAEKAAARALKKGASDARETSTETPTSTAPAKQNSQKARPNAPPREASDSRHHKAHQGTTSKQPSVTETARPYDSRGDPTVSVFAHLREKPKRLTLAAASKDVHPAIQALGLQYSMYEICGSTARGIAMLLALKQVDLTQD